MPSPHSANAEPILGIDLGTTNSLVAVCDVRGPRILDGADGSLLPSIVAFTNEGAVLVGRPARDAATSLPGRTISSVKRLMGRSAAEVETQDLGYTVVPGERGQARIRLPDGRTLAPEEVSAHILAELKRTAEAALGLPVRRAVITVPAYFDDAQRQATRHAGRLAGLEVVRIVAEPTAAALAYGLDRPADGAGRTVAVYDLGGGTFDLSILRLTPGQGDEPGFFEVVSTNGDTRLGGDDIDSALASLLADAAAEATGRRADDLRRDPAVALALKTAAEAAKIALTDAETTEMKVALPGGLWARRAVTRAELEALMEPLVQRTLACCERAMRDAAPALHDGKVDAVIMVGGSTRTPLIRRRAGEFFGVEPYTAIDPDRAVALGAAVQGAILSGARKDALLLDVIPLSLGIETMGGAVAKLILKNSTLPARAREFFSTSKDGQTSIRLTVFQGEREMAADCRKLAEFHLRGLPPMPAGLPQVEVQFLADANGVLSVTATERRSGRRASLQVIPNYGLTHEEVDRMEAESLTHAREDMTRHRIADLIANSRLDLKWIGDRLARHAADLEPAYAKELAALRDALAAFVSRAEADWRGVDPNAFHAAKEALDRASVRLQEVSITASLKSDPPRA